jgi:hypothetical protein
MRERSRGSSSKHRNWNKVVRREDQYMYDRRDKKHNDAVEKFFSKVEKRKGKKIKRDWND